MVREKLFPIPLAVESLTGHRPHPTTGWRWATKGCCGVILETKRLGGKMLCSVEAVQRFMDAVEHAKAQEKSVSLPEPIAKPTSRAMKATEQLRAVTGGRI